MDFNQFVFNDFNNIEEYSSLVEKAKDVDAGAEAPQVDLAYSLYAKAAEAHNFFAERRLGSMCINGDGTDKDFQRGVGFYLMAAEDGDEYSEAVLQTIIPEIDISVIDKANKGDTRAMQQLSNLYYSYGKHYNRAIELCAKAVLKDDISAAIALVRFLILKDLTLYLEHPNYFEKYYQDDEWKRIAIRHLNNNAIYGEVLLVNSRERIKQIFDILKYIIVNYSSSQEIIDAAFNCFVAAVNSFNSFNRSSDLLVKNNIINIQYPPFSDSWISQFTDNQNVLLKGLELHRSNKIVKCNICNDTYSAFVLGNSGKVYSPHFTINSVGSVSDEFCNCIAFKKYNGVCKHIVSMFYKVQEKEKRYNTYRGTVIPEYTSVTGSMMRGGNDKNLYIYRLEDMALEKYIKVILTISTPIFNSLVEQYNRENISLSEYTCGRHSVIIARLKEKSKVIIGHVLLGENEAETDNLKNNMANLISQYA